MDITDLILDGHYEQRRLFLRIDHLSGADKTPLAAVWARLRGLLDRHAEAEERFFYPELLKIGSGAADADGAAEETRDAIKDHNKIRNAATAADKHEVGSPEWFERVAATNKENSDHMAEEERQGLSDFRSHADPALRDRLARDFVRFSAENLAGVQPIDKHPDSYVKEHS